MITVLVSGGFDPLNIFHVRMFKEAKAMGDKLIVLLNNDYWLMKKNGEVLVPENERKELIESFKWVDQVIFTTHTVESTDLSVCTEIEMIRPDIFANGGNKNKKDLPEFEICDKLGVMIADYVGDKRGGLNEN